MHGKHLGIAALLAGSLLGVAGAAQETIPVPGKKEPLSTFPEKKDYTQFSRYLHDLAVKSMPKYVEDRSGWGQTVPIEDNLPLPRLRTRLKVGDGFAFPHGAWKRSRVWVTEPPKDVTVVVREFTRKDSSTYKLLIDAEVLWRGEAELRVWQKGLALVKGVTVQADGVLGLALDCDVGWAFKTKNFFPEIAIEPKLVDCKLSLQEFNLREVDTKRAGIVLAGQQAVDLGKEIKGLLQNVITQYEPEIKAKANDAIAEGIRQGKGTISTATMLQIFGPGGAPKQ